jgi:tetratricopeptide (TPR) repeat protein
LERTGSQNPNLEEFAAWARAWVNPIPPLISRIGTDSLPEGVLERAIDLEVALLDASSSFEDARTAPQRLQILPGPDGQRARDQEVPARGWPEVYPAAEHARRALADALTGALSAAQRRFSASSDLADADVAMAIANAAVASNLPGSVDRALLQISLARIYLGRQRIDRSDEASIHSAYEIATDSLAMLDALFSRSADAEPSEAMGLVEANGVLAEVLSERFTARGEDADLDRALAHAGRSRSLADAVDPIRRASADDRLALLLRLRHDHRGDDRDLDLAIVHAEAAVAGTPTDDPDYAMRLGNLGLRLATRFNLSGDRNDLDRSIDLAHAGLAIGGLSPHDRRRLLGNLAIRLKTRHAQMSHAEDLDAAIAMEAEAMTLAPVGTPQPLWLLNNYGVSLSARYARRGDPSDLDRAIALAEEALALSPPGNADRPSRLSNLSIVLSSRYEHRGDAVDLDRAIELSGQSIAETPAGSPFLNIRQHNHGTHLAIRYDRQGAPEDLDDAIELARAALDGTPEDSPDQPSRRGTLALRYAARYAGRGKREDLAAAIREGERALAMTPRGALERPVRLASLATSLAHRWQSDRRDVNRELAHARPSGQEGEVPTPDEADDLDRAITLTTEAIDLVDLGNPERATTLAALARFRHRRYQARGNREDLDSAIVVASAAVDATVAGHPSRASRMSLLATLLGDASNADGVTTSRVLDLHRDAWEAVTSTPGFSGFAVVAIGHALAAALRDRIKGMLHGQDHDASIVGGRGAGNAPVASPDQGSADPILVDELWRVLCFALDALDGYLARLPVDADDAALFAVGTYGHLYSWLIDAAVDRVEGAQARGLDPLPLIREAFTSIERSKGRRLVSRLQAGALRPTPLALPLVEALERLKPEIDRLETLLYGGSEPPHPSVEGDERSSGTTLGWLGEGVGSASHSESSGPRDVVLDWATPGSTRAWDADIDSERREADVARMAARHAALRDEFTNLLRQIERSDPTYATARGYAAPRSPDAIAQALPPGAVLILLAPLATRTVAVVLGSDGTDHGRTSLALTTFAISELQWARLVDQTFRREASDANPGGREWSLSTLDRELEGTLRAIGDRLIPAVAPLLPDDRPDGADPGQSSLVHATSQFKLGLTNPSPAATASSSSHAPESTLRHLVIVPTGAIHRLPLHAVPWSPHGIARWDGTTRLIDRFVVTYASTADLLPLVSKRPVAADGITSFAPGLGLSPRDEVPHVTLALAAALAQRASSGRLDLTATSGMPDDRRVALRLREHASRDEALSRAVFAGRRLSFVATHGRAGGVVGSGLLVHSSNRGAHSSPAAAEQESPARGGGPPTALITHYLATGVDPLPSSRGEPAREELGGRWSNTAAHGRFLGTWVTAEELLARLDLSGVDHFQLLACSTHADDPAPGDHLFSLLTTLQICGARSVGGTLWAVDEVAAVLVGWQVGTSLIEGESDKAQALHRATQWLRKASIDDVLEVIAALGDALAATLPVEDRAHDAIASLRRRLANGSSGAPETPYADVVHWAPYVLHGAPLVGSHG